MMKHLRHVWLIALKDLRLFVRDRLALFFFVLFPFLFIVLFNLVLSGVGGGDDRLELHLVTGEAEGGLSYQIIGTLETTDDSQLQPGQPRIVWDREYDKARQAVQDKDLDGFLAFPSNFTEGVLTGDGAQLEVVAQAEATDTRAALNGLAQAIASRVASQRAAASATIELLVEEGLINAGDPAAIQRVIEQIFHGQGEAGGRSFIQFEVEKVGEVEAENAANYVIPGYLVMFVFFAGALGAEMIVRERQNHTLERLLAGSVRRESLLGGMFIGTAAKGLIQIAVFWAIGILAFHIDLGLSPVAVILVSVLMVIASASFAMMLATLAKTERSAGSVAVLASLVLAPLGGCWWPLFITPKWMQFIAKITPHGWANTAFNKLMLFGADFNAAIPAMLALIGFTVGFALIAVWRFRTSAEG